MAQNLPKRVKFFRLNASNNPRCSAYELLQIFTVIAMPQLLDKRNLRTDQNIDPYIRNKKQSWQLSGANT